MFLLYITAVINDHLLVCMNAFKYQIPDGLVRILIRIENVKCKVYNAAPEHLHPKDDDIWIKIGIDHPLNTDLDILEQKHRLEINQRRSDDEYLVLELAKQGIWFDINMEDVKDIWVSEYRYQILSANHRFLKYDILDLDHTIEWLQTDAESGEIRSLSNFTKKFSPANLALEEVYSSDDILRCADVIGKAIQKIDLRSRSALVRLHTEDGRLEKLIKEMADRLGYEFSQLEDTELDEIRRSGGDATHSIKLKR